MRVIDLFCSAGGASLGAKLAGHNVILGVDLNGVALDAHQANHPETELWQRDISDITARDLPKADIIMGSTPCKNFSQINRLGRDLDMTLTHHFLQLVKEYQKINGKILWTCENVPTIVKYLPRGTPGRVLGVADYGVPQKRFRWIGGNYRRPRETHAKTPCGDLKQWVPFKEIRDRAGKKSWISKKGFQGAFDRANKMGRRGYDFGIHILDVDDVLFTITSSEFHGLRAGSSLIYDGGRLRNITFLEARRAQSFPDDYIFRGTVKEKWRQVGDAVPPLLMKALLGGH